MTVMNQIPPHDGPTADERVIDVRNLTVELNLGAGRAKVVDDISFAVAKGETVCLVGESGCGKSVTARTLLRLMPKTVGGPTEGEIEFEGQNLLALSDRGMQTVRGDRISMIFQEPMSSLNPLFTVGEQIAEVFRIHRGMSRSEAREAALEMLNRVQIADPERRLNEYPHRMSGGMRQRVMIAIALSCRPRLLIADEPTTALDVTIQEQVLDLIDRLKEEFGMSVLLITHDLGVVAERADRVLVMYAGRIVESAPTADLFTRPRHPYTQGLIAAMPKIGDTEPLSFIPGIVPGPLDLPGGCRFRDRCRLAQDICGEHKPELTGKDGHWTACHFV